MGKTRRLGVVPALALLLALPAGAMKPTQPDGRPAAPWTIAHRGASAYTPENTVPAFRLAAAQGAHFVEFDLQRTKDGVLVCLHDATLERTTDVARVFPERARPAADGSGPARWWLEDFALDEVRRLDAGAWFDDRFAGTRIPTFAETIESLRGRAGLFIELKLPERYPGIEVQLLNELKAHGLDQPGADAATPVLIQSFTVESIERLAALKTRLPLHVLFSARDASRWLSDDGLARVRAMATGISPEKSAFGPHADAVRRARDLGLHVTPWTFRASAVQGFDDVRAEMQHYVQTYRVDGLITDNPDLVPSAFARDQAHWLRRDRSTVDCGPQPVDCGLSNW
jgi:glycerophosphoryl diester phosphodiesterase